MVLPSVSILSVKLINFYMSDKGIISLVYLGLGLVGPSQESLGIYSW